MAAASKPRKRGIARGDERGAGIRAQCRHDVGDLLAGGRAVVGLEVPDLPRGLGVECR